MTDKMKPCPFCGGEAENLSDYSCDCCGKPYNGNIQCKLCGAEVSHFDTDAEAVFAWNTRADAEALKAADELAILALNTGCSTQEDADRLHDKIAAYNNTRGQEDNTND